ncbi:MAG: TonB-dependent receptor plug domain-containing protein, partial [Pseudomonadota bacterium]
MTTTNDSHHPMYSVGTRYPRNALLAGVLIALAANVATAQDDDADTPIDEVEVFATPLGNTIDEIGQGVTVLQGDALSRQLANTIGETLALQPGVTASDFGAGASRPVVRGLAGPRVRVQEDGISTLDVSTISVDHAVALEPLIIERVEILRGPATLAYGSGAVGGVVNTISERLPDSLTDGVDGRFQITGNTVADERYLALGLNGSAGNIAWHVDGMGRDAGNYEIPGVAIILEDFEEEQPDGFVQNSDLESSSWGAGLGWVGERAYLSFAVSGFDTNYGLPTLEEEEEEEGEEGGEEEEEGPIRLDLEQTRFDFKGGIQPQSGFISQIEVRGAYNDYAHIEFEGDETGTTFDNEAFEGRIDITHAPIGDWEGAFGLQVELREFSAIGAEAFVPPTETTAFGLYLIEELDLDEWFFSIGGRVETQEQDPESGESVDDTAFSLSASAIRRLANSHRLGLTLS